MFYQHTKFAFVHFVHKCKSTVTFTTAALLFMVWLTWKSDTCHLKVSSFGNQSGFDITNAICGLVPGLIERCVRSYTEKKKKFDDTDIIVVPWPILYWRFTENQGLLVLVQPVCVFQTYELLLQQYFWLTVKYILLNYLKTFSYIHMADKSQAFHSV